MLIHSNASESRSLPTMLSPSAHRAALVHSGLFPTLFLLSRLITVSLTQSISNLFNQPDKTINSNRKESQLNRPNGLLANPHPIANPSQKQLRHEHRSVIP
jgi:hypothetical protein